MLAVGRLGIEYHRILSAIQWVASGCLRQRQGSHSLGRKSRWFPAMCRAGGHFSCVRHGLHAFHSMCVCVQLFSVCDCMSRRIYMYLLIERYHSPYCYYHYCYDSTYYYCIPVRVRVSVSVCVGVLVFVFLFVCVCAVLSVGSCLWQVTSDSHIIPHSCFLIEQPLS